MYSTCLFCHGRLGANDVIEYFPIGRRLAFDADKGRLWVICPSCHRWNLTPLEERWEAVEDLERRVRATTFRVSTDNIGLARLRGGLDAVRIGKPLRPEMAGWRYGRILQQRFWRRTVPVSIAGIALLAVPIAGWLFGQFGPPDAVRVRLADGGRMRLTAEELGRSQFIATEGEGWSLRLRAFLRSEDLAGEPAVRAAGLVLARLNWGGARRTDVANAVRYLADARDADGAIVRIARLAQQTGIRHAEDLPFDVLLALEMAVHDSNERDALAGQLVALEAAWRDAETIAAIADNL